MGVAVDGVGPQVQREGEHQGEGARLPDPLHVDAARPGRREHEHRDADDELPDEHQHADHEGHAALHDQRDRGHQEQDAVGDRVEHLAEVAALVEVAGDPAVDPVGGAEHGQQRGRREQLVVGEQPDEDRCAGEAGQRDHVRDRDDPRPAVRPHRPNRTRSIQNSPVYAPPSTGMAVPVTKDAASEQRNAATRPKSVGSPSTPAGIPACVASSSPP